jgi:hypothetical protein
VWRPKFHRPVSVKVESQLRHAEWVCLPGQKIIQSSNREKRMYPRMGKTSLILLATIVPLAMAGCATRESVEQAQASANAADSHAGDARMRADHAQARADEAAGIGGNAMTSAQAAGQHADSLDTQLAQANAKIHFLERNVVYKHVKHRKHRRVHHHTATNSDHSGT